MVVSVGMLGEDSWPPAVDFYDFLKVMDMQESDASLEQTPQEEEELDEEEVNAKEDVVLEEGTDSSSSSPNTHSEL